jgi:hypothetical protein
MYRLLLLLCVGLVTFATGAHAQNSVRPADVNPDNVNQNAVSQADAVETARRLRVMNRARQRAAVAANERMMQQQRQSGSANLPLDQQRSQISNNQGSSYDSQMNQQFGANSTPVRGRDYNGIHQTADGQWVDQNGNVLSPEALQNLNASGSATANGSGVQGSVNADRPTVNRNGLKNSFNQNPSAFQRNPTNGINGNQGQLNGQALSNGQQQMLQNLGNGVQNSGNGIQNPGNGIQNPGNGIQNPGNGIAGGGINGNQTNLGLPANQFPVNGGQVNGNPGVVVRPPTDVMQTRIPRQPMPGRVGVQPLGQGSVQGNGGVQGVGGAASASGGASGGGATGSGGGASK